MPIEANAIGIEPLSTNIF